MSIPLGYASDASSSGMGFRAGATSAAAADAPIEFGGDAPLLTIAPTGAGKSLSAVIPALLTWLASMIVLDIKGELCAVTARWRRALGQAVYVLAPFGLPHGLPKGAILAGLDPLALILPFAASAADDAMMLAAAIFPDEATLQDRFWRDNTLLLMGALILWLARYGEGEQRHLAHLGRLAHLAPHEIAQLAHALTIAAQEAYDRNLSGADLLRAASSMLIDMPAVTLRCILSTMGSVTAILLSPAVQSALRDIHGLSAALARGDMLTLYIVIPPDRLESHGALIRLWLTLIIGLMTRRITRPAQDTLLLVDEAAQFGTLPALRTAYSLLRGYGVKSWLILQSLTQLKSLYPTSWRVFIENAGATQLFGPMTQSLADAMEELTGAAIDPWTLQADEQLLSMAGARPIRARRFDYRTDARFAGRFDPNPFFAAREGDPR